MSPMERLKARKEYLQIITDYDRIFIDPITQESLSIEQHCAPLKLATEAEWNAMMTTEFDMDYEDDKLMRLERLGQSKQSTKEYENAVDFLINVSGQKYIILGAAAAGKTVMMKLLFYKAAQKALKDPKANIPILTPITTLSSFEKDMDFKLKLIRGLFYTIV